MEQFVVKDVPEHLRDNLEQSISFYILVILTPHSYC